MKRADMEQRLREELERIPRGEYEQNVLRAIYNMTRRSDLGKNPATPRAASLSEAVRFVRKDHPDFTPEFDQAYFGL